MWSITLCVHHIRKVLDTRRIQFIVGSKLCTLITKLEITVCHCPSGKYYRDNNIIYTMLIVGLGRLALPANKYCSLFPLATVSPASRCPLPTNLLLLGPLLPEIHLKSEISSLKSTEGILCSICTLTILEERAHTSAEYTQNCC